MTDVIPREGDRSCAWGPMSALGLGVAAAASLTDQGAKLWLLSLFDAAGRAHVTVTTFLDFVLTWNTGISYGLFPQEGPLGQWALLGFKTVAVVFLWVWLARSSSRLTAVALGLVIGGALGNGIDQLHWPGVMDFVLLHFQGNGWSFHWYVFNLADVAIVAGVLGLLYESLRGVSPQKRPDPG